MGRVSNWQSFEACNLAQREPWESNRANWHWRYQDCQIGEGLDVGLQEDHSLTAGRQGG